MTPFDPVVLVAVLTAYYPIVGAAALQAARSARPIYFAAGTLGGSSRTLLTLPDGRVFALVDPTANGGAGAWTARAITAAGPAAALDASTRTFDDAAILAFIGSYAGLTGVDPSVASDPQYWLRRIKETGGLGEDNKGYWVDRFYGIGGDTPDGLTLEPGPLAPIDPIDVGLPVSSPTQFEDLVGGQLGALDGSTAQLDAVHATVTSFDPAATAAALDDGRLDAADAAHAGTVASLAGETVDGLVEQTEGYTGRAAANRTTYDDEPPPEQDVPDPGPKPPRDGGDDGGGPPKA